MVYMFNSGSSEMKNEIANSPASITRVINETSSAEQNGKMLQVMKQPTAYMIVRIATVIQLSIKNTFKNFIIIVILS